jgi:hypothetical protein
MHTTKRIEKFNLTSRENQTVVQALQMARSQFLKDHMEFLKLAEYIRGGGEYPMFAPGENGAKAAERLAGQFALQANDCLRLLLVLEPDVYDEDDLIEDE